MRLNEQFPDKIRFEHDGIFSKVIVVKSKNYILLPENEKKFKTDVVDLIFEMPGYYMVIFAFISFIIYIYTYNYNLCI